MQITKIYTTCHVCTDIRHIRKNKTVFLHARTLGLLYPWYTLEDPISF